MNSVKVGDKYFELFIDNQEIQQKIAEIAKSIEEEYRHKKPVFLCVLNGAFMFAADLMRLIQIPAEVSFIKLSSYTGMQSTGDVKTLIGLNNGISGRHVILVEDIIDTGKTIHELLPLVHAKGPASVKLASILSKPDARTHDVQIDFTGFEIPDKFVVGYGLDYNQLGRNLPDIYALADE